MQIKFTLSEGFHIRTAKKHPAVCPTTALQKYHPPHPSHKAISPSNGKHPKEKCMLFCLFVLFLTLLLMTLFSSKGVQCNEWEQRDGAGQAAPDAAGYCQPSGKILHLLPLSPFTGYVSSILYLFHICTFHHIFFLDFQGEHSLAFEIFSYY